MLSVFKENKLEISNRKVSETTFEQLETKQQTSK